MADILAICCGGLGADQTWQIQQALSGVTKVSLVSAGGLDGYKTNLAALITPRPRRKLAMVCHSFGGETGLLTCQQLAAQGITVDYLALLDPVSYSPFWAGTMAYPVGTAAPTAANIWYSQTPFLVVPATITGGPASVTIPGTDHNSLCHVLALITALVTTISAL